MAFRGWPVEAIEFFEGLEADNSKAYWLEHKDVYERCVQQPMEELLAELAPELGAGKLFRPYRDVRFSKDKTPYKTDHPRIELLRAKGLIMWHRWPPAPWMGTPSAKARVAEVIRAAEPLRRWLADHVDPATADTSRR